MTNVIETITNTYLSRTKNSRAHDTRAKQSLPGGDTRTTTYFMPYPPYMERGEGCYLYDCDGNRYIDFLNNYTSLIHGHAFPPIVQAARAQIEKGTVFGAPMTLQYQLAETICARVPSIQRVRFCNSGTEATMMALRAARAFTGKDIIVKMDGGYHGTHDFVEVNVAADPRSNDLPTAHVEGAGVPACVLDGMRVARFNDLASVETVLREHADKIAGIILEPMPGAGGLVPPKPGYLNGMRELADRYGVLLIFDEIITFRLGIGGMQSAENVKPDLTALGKIIGGGFAIGAFGGRKDIMARFDPAQPQAIAHSGTFSGHNVAMAAGIVTLQHYDRTAVDRINALGDRLRQGFTRAFQAAGIKGHAGGLGSLVSIHWGDEKIESPSDVTRGVMSAGNLTKLLHLEMTNRGIHSAARGMYVISTPMSETEIDEAVQTFGATLEMLKPQIVETAPHLLA